MSLKLTFPSKHKHIFSILIVFICYQFTAFGSIQSLRQKTNFAPFTTQAPTQYTNFSSQVTTQLFQKTDLVLVETEVRVIEKSVTKSSFIVSDGSTIPYTALWESDNPVNSGEHYWQFTIGNITGSVYVGLGKQMVVNSENFIACIYYGQHLYNREVCVVENYGPRIRSGDIIGMYVNYLQNRLQVYFDLNGKYMGLAFDLSSDRLLEAYPFVQFSKTGSVSCTKLEFLPHYRNAGPQDKYCLSGPWILDFLFKTVDNNLNMFFNISNMNRPILNIQTVENQIIIFANIGFNFSTTLFKQGNAWVSGYKPSALVSGAMHKGSVQTELMDILTDPDFCLKIANSLTIGKRNVVSSWIRNYQGTKPYIGY